jgi:hypothetical protein
MYYSDSFAHSASYGRGLLLPKCFFTISPFSISYMRILELPFARGNVIAVVYTADDPFGLDRPQISPEVYGHLETNCFPGVQVATPCCYYCK